MNLYGRIFAAFYDRMLAATEEAGLRDRRRALIAEASGDVLEIGAGTGLNLPHYSPDRVGSLVLAEPEEPMARRLLERAPSFARVVQAPAEDLPFDDDSFDFVVSTLVLCTVKSPEGALAEIERVLRPGGKLLFLEHIRSDDPQLAKRQDRIRPIWQHVGHGCQTNRPTPDTIAKSKLELGEVEHGSVPKAPKFVKPMAIGSATAPRDP